jgi:hypothetical protein
MACRNFRKALEELVMGVASDRMAAQVAGDAAGSDKLLVRAVRMNPASVERIW